MTHFLKTFPVVAMQTCPPEWRTNTKNCNILTAKNKNTSNQFTFEKKIYVNSTEMYGISVPPRIDTLSEQSMSQYAIQPGACSARY